jgi:hypothetical protein
MFRHGYVNTTNLVERMWHYVKYTLLDGKVNCRLDELILAIIGNPETGRRFGGNTLVEHYNDAHFLSMSGKYSKRGGDKGRTAKLQKARWLVQRYKQDRATNLEIIDACHLEFAFRSQSTANKWYIVSLSREWCECNDHGPICKHMWALKIIVQEEFQHLLDLLPSAYEPHGFIHEDEEDGGSDEGPNGKPDGGPDGRSDGGPDRGPDGGPSGGPDEEPDGRPNDGVQNVRRDVQVARLHEITSLMTTTKMEDLSQEQYDKIDITTKLILDLLEGRTTQGPRPRQIPMPREGGSITPIQAHVTRTRLGFGSQKKKRKLNHEEQGVQEEPIVHSPRPSGSKVPKRRQLFVQKKRMRVRLPKLCKEACPSCGDLNIFFKGIINTECKNCQHMIVREGGSVVPDKVGCEIDQDLESFFKDLDIY